MLHDAIIIGGSFAGLAAATYIGRARRTAVVIDTGQPRNRFAEHSHGLLTRDGDSPLDMLVTAREQVRAYPTLQFTEGAAASAVRTDEGFGITLANGDRLEGRRLVLAFGISDILPDLPGVAERWGNSVIHCPYCHGYEFSDQQLGVLNMQPKSSHQAMLISEWGPTTFYLNGGEIDDATRTELLRRKVTIEAAPVKALHGPGQSLHTIELEDGITRPIAALYLGCPTQMNSQIAHQLGCEMEDGPMGEFIKTDAMKQTTVPGVWAAGDITRAMHNITAALGDGVSAGVGVHASLVF